MLFQFYVYTFVRSLINAKQQLNTEKVLIMERILDSIHTPTVTPKPTPENVTDSCDCMCLYYSTSLPCNGLKQRRNGSTYMALTIVTYILCVLLVLLIAINIILLRRLKRQRQQRQLTHGIV